MGGKKISQLLYFTVSFIPCVVFCKCCKYGRGLLLGALAKYGQPNFGVLVQNCNMAALDEMKVVSHVAPPFHSRQMKI